MKVIRYSISALLLLINCQIAFCAVTSLDNVFVPNDVFSSDFSSRLNRNFTQVLTGGINSINAANVVDDSLGESEMADEINPRIRTYEGAACEFVFTGLLPATSGSLTANTSAGTAYPRGYRINKASSTAHSYTASKWTWVDVDQNGDFQYSEVAIGGATPSVATNSIRLAKVSSDGVTVNTVTDLRKTSCASGPFSVIVDTPSEATLADVLSKGHHNRQSGDIGWVQGLKVSWDTGTTFKVQSGSAYINGHYRFMSTDISVPQTNDDPSNSISGLDTSSISSNTRYAVYAAADQSAVAGFSISYSTSEANPNGVTNYRKIGYIKTDGSSKFASYDVMTTHDINQKEIIGGWVNFKNVGTTVINKSYNVSALTDNGDGDTTIAWERPFNASSDYVVVGMHKRSGGLGGYCSPQDNVSAILAGSARIVCTDNNGSAAADGEPIMVMATGERP